MKNLLILSIGLLFFRNSYAENAIVIQNNDNVPQSLNNTSKVIVIDNNVTPSPIGSTTQDSNGTDNYKHAFTIGAGYNKSQWKHFDSSLKNRGLQLELSFAKKSSLYNSDCMLTFSQSSYDLKEQEAIYFGTIGFGKKFFIGDDGLSATIGSHVLLGSYRVWLKSSESSSSITFQKKSSGILLGLDPRVGARIRITQSLYFNVEGIYSVFFDSPQSKLGRWTAMLSLSHMRF